MSDRPDTQNRLDRTLGLWHLVLFGLAYTAPLVVLLTFGILDKASKGTAAGSYLLASLAIFLTAASYGRMAQLYPSSGSAYVYARKAIAAPVGFMVGWSVLLDYFLAPMVVALIISIYLSASFPQVPHALFVIGFLCLITVVNILGIRIASGVNGVLMLVQALVIAAFLALAVRYVVEVQGTASLDTVTPFFRHDVPLSLTAYGASLAALSFLGFDAVSTLSAEARAPERDVPRAILLVAIIAGLVFVAAAFMAQLVEAGEAIKDPASVGLSLARKVGGDIFATIFLVGLIVSQLAAGISAQAGVGRLLYAMGNDGVLPRQTFGYVSALTKTPVFNIVLSGLVGVLALVLSEEQATSLVNFGAFVAFTFVNLSVIATWFSSRRGGEPRNAFIWLVVPAFGAAFTIWLLVSLNSNAKIAGLLWIAAGFVYLVCLTRMFRRPTPDIGAK